MKNQAIRTGDRDLSGRYTTSERKAGWFTRHILPTIEAARKRGDVVRVVNGWWQINGNPIGA